MGTTFASTSETHYRIISIINSPIGLTETEAFQKALFSSLEEHEDREDQLESCQLAVEEDMSDDQYREKVKLHATQHVVGEARSIVVSRSSIWATALPYFKRKKFLQGGGIIQVTFATFEGEEDAEDLGSPRREFLHLLLGAICKDSKTICGM